MIWTGAKHALTDGIDACGSTENFTPFAKIEPLECRSALYSAI